jgi:uncharacterized membrane protein YkoI
MKIFAIALLLSFTFSGCADINNEKIEWAQLPLEVQKTFSENLEGGKILEIEKETEKKTITVYEATIQRPDGREIEIKVEENGMLFELEGD